MKILFSLSLFFIFFSSCNLKNENKPIMKLSKSLILMDTISVNQNKTETVTITNSGSDTLFIEKFTCSCECTALNLKDSTIILPKDSILLPLTVKAYLDDANKWKNVLCTLKSNADSIFSRIQIRYYTKK